jgi:osmotically-inducible protein OsmY
VAKARFVFTWSLFLVLVLAGSSPGQRHGERDERIRVAVAQLLASKSDYKNVKADVDDRIVTLRGNVELDSTRRFLVQRIRHIAHVERVRNELVLDPPAMEDKALLGRVQQQLEDSGFKGLTIKAHEGAVTLLGMVRNTQALERAIQIARQTPGVKEVESRLTVAEQ